MHYNNTYGTDQTSDTSIKTHRWKQGFKDIYWLTLVEQGSWMLLECGEGLNQPAPSRSPKNTEKPKFFGFSESS